MPTIKKPKVGAKIIAKAKQVLTFAQDKARTCKDSSELFNAIFSPSGKAVAVFPDESERDAFFRTKEYKKIRELENDLPNPPVQHIGDLLANAELTLHLRVPKSLYDALQAEASDEGVNLDQLCLAKLVAQLRKVV